MGPSFSSFSFQVSRIAFTDWKAWIKRQRVEERIIISSSCGIKLVNKVIDSSNSEMHSCTCLRNYHAEIGKVFYQTDASEN